MNQRTDDTMTKQKGKETNNGQQNACYTDNYPHQNLGINSDVPKW